MFLPRPDSVPVDKFTLLEEKLKQLPPLVPIDMLVNVFGFKRDTIYDWRYRPHNYNIPDAHNLFVRPRTILFVNRDVLAKWLLNKAKERERKYASPSLKPRSLKCAYTR